MKAEHVQPGKKGRLVSSIVFFWLPESAPFQKRIFITEKGDGELLFKGQKCLCFGEWRSHDSAGLCHWCCCEWADTALQARSAGGVPAVAEGRVSGLEHLRRDWGQMIGILPMDSAIGWGSAWGAEPSLGDGGKSRIVSIIGVQEMLSQIWR